MGGRGINRRELIAAGVAVGVGVGVRGVPVARAAPTRLDFAKLGDGHGWPGWVCPGVANLDRAGGAGTLAAGSDVFPCDPRPVAFAIDRRFRHGEVEAAVTAGGAGVGVVVRRISPRDYYAAIFDSENGALLVMRRSGDELVELARTPAPQVRAPFRLKLRTEATTLAATLDTGLGIPVTAQAKDATPALQRPGDPGVLATARTLFPSEGPAPVPSLGNVHLLPYGVQEGEAFIESPAGQAVVGEIKERSTAVFEWIEVRPASGVKRTAPGVIAAVATPRGHDGVRVRVASDVPARVEIEFSTRADFRHSRPIPAGRTDGHQAAATDFPAIYSRETVYWRPRLHRAGKQTVGPARSFRPLPGAGAPLPATIAVGACAAQFGPIFDHLAAEKPHAFVWQGDLNYPDTLGPLAQNTDAYAGIWRDFLANPKLRPLLDRGLFAAQRDDHDYAVQDANSTNLVPWGVWPWESLMDNRLYYRFSAGLADFWVLDQRRHKSDPTTPDGPNKTLLGAKQRAWLLRTLAASTAPFKVICSPCTLALPANGRDGNWASHFTAERDIVLKHIRKHVSGRTIFLTGDTHWTMVYDKDGLFEARACPLDIPTPNDITISSPNAAEDARGTPGVQYADDDYGHVTIINLSGHGNTAHLDLKLLRQDGAEPYRRRFTERVPR
jgi:hypothetical protein